MDRLALSPSIDELVSSAMVTDGTLTAEDGVMRWVWLAGLVLGCVGDKEDVNKTEPTVPDVEPTGGTGGTGDTGGGKASHPVVAPRHTGLSDTGSLDTGVVGNPVVDAPDAELPQTAPEAADQR